MESMDPKNFAHAPYKDYLVINHFLFAWLWAEAMSTLYMIVFSRCLVQNRHPLTWRRNEQAVTIVSSKQFTHSLTFFLIVLEVFNKVFTLLQSQPIFRAEQCMCIIVPHKDSSAGTILTGLCDTSPGHPPTHSSFGSQSTIPLHEAGHTPWCSSHTPC